MEAGKRMDSFIKFGKDYFSSSIEELLVDLLVCWSFGIAVGIGLMFSWMVLGRQRAIALQEKANQTVTLANVSFKDIGLLFGREFIPYWIVFSKYEKVNWINKHLHKVWPLLSEASSALLKEVWEPYLDIYKPALLSSITFQKFSLGTIAPTVRGVRLVDTSDDEIVLDAECQWEGNPSIILAVLTHVGVSLPVQVKDIGIAVVIRFIFKPLLEELPGFGAFTYSIRRKKKLDFRLKVIGGDISAVPGLAGTVDGLIRAALIDSFVWPMRIPVPIISSPVDGDFTRLQRHMCDRRGGVIYNLRDLGANPVGILDIKMVQAKELFNGVQGEKLDPFAILYIRPIPAHMKKSKTIKNDAYPLWNEQYELELEDPASQTLFINIFDENSPQETQLIGCAQVHLRDLNAGMLTELWLKLVKDPKNEKEGKYRGQMLFDNNARKLSICISFSSIGKFSKLVLYNELHPVPLYLLYGKRRVNVSNMLKSSLKNVTVPQVNVELLYRPFNQDILPMNASSLPVNDASSSSSPVKIAGSPTHEDRLDPERSGRTTPPLHVRHSFKGKLWEIVRGVLTVTVIRAENLTPHDLNGKSDPFVVLQMKKSRTKRETKVIFKTLNPEWNQTFDFLVEDGIHDMLMVKVWDYDTFGKDFMGKYATTLTRVIREGEYDCVFKLDGAPSGKLYLKLTWTPQPVVLLRKVHIRNQ